MKDKNYYRRYREKHRTELREYGKLWMRAHRHKTSKPKLNIIPEKQTKPVDKPLPQFEFKAKGKCNRCGIKVGKGHIYEKFYLYKGKKVCEDCYKILKI